MILVHTEIVYANLRKITDIIDDNFEITLSNMICRNTNKVYTNAIGNQVYFVKNRLLGLNG